MSATRSQPRRLFGSVLLMVLVSACHELGLGARDFTITVDSVTGPLTVAPGAAITQFLHGPVGPDLCSSVKSLRVVRTERGADVTVIGSRHNGSCGQMPVYMNSYPATITPPLPNPFVLRVRGGGATWLERTIRVQ